MAIQAQATFAIKNWIETSWEGKPSQEVSGPKLTRAEVAYTYAGDIEGESQVQYLMCYSGEGAHGSFVGLEQITGALGGKSGSFTLQHTGTFDSDGVHVTVTVVPDSGTHELSGLRGSGSFDLTGHQERYPFYFDYVLEETTE